MKKIVLSLAALAALSTASLAAGNRNWDLQDVEQYSSSGYAGVDSASNVTDSAPLAVEGSAGLTAYERMMLRSEEREHGDR